MKNILFFSVLAFFFLGSHLAIAQDTPKPNNGKVNVFYDCQSTWKCNNYYDFVRTEVKMVEFVRDRFYADVHLLITEQGTGGGGSIYRLQFLGQKRFQNQNDTLEVSAAATATDEEVRKEFVKKINLGMIKYVSKTDFAQYLTINFDVPKGDSIKKTEKDPWNYWVYSIGGNINFNGDTNYSDNNYNANTNISRVTEDQKFSLWLGYNRNENKYIYGKDTTRVSNNRLNLYNEYGKSINQHWSIGVEVGAASSTFENIKFRAKITPKVEYSVFPYKDFNAKRLVFGYSIGPQFSAYNDTTIYFKKRELRGQQTAYAIASFTQKWGNINIGLDYSNYLHDFSINKFGLGGAIEWRIYKGLRLAMFGNFEFIRDQISLPKGSATRDDVLTRRRLIGSSFNYWAGTGIRYQFGSQNNSVVNPRFNGLNYSISF